MVKKGASKLPLLKQMEVPWKSIKEILQV